MSNLTALIAGIAGLVVAVTALVRALRSPTTKTLNKKLTAHESAGHGPASSADSPAAK